MKICICTTPIRPIPTTFPPLGSMAIIQALRERGREVAFYNIDYHRPSYEDVERHFAENKYDVIGISAVVSTAYAYTKALATTIRGVAPGAVIIVGGNLAASAEILHRKCKIDFCVVGDGELVINPLIDQIAADPGDFNALKAIPGLTFVDGADTFHFTGFATPLPYDQIRSPDWTILEEDESLDYFISTDIPWDDRAKPESSSSRFGVVQPDKGCVVRCTFCHRFERGYRVRPLDQLRRELELLKADYGVSFIGFATENFGSDRKTTWKFVEMLSEMGMQWRAGAVRVRSVSPEILAHWKRNGCHAVYYGIETGSQRMIEVMEKKATIQMNLDALRWTFEAGLFTILQFVIGMPGETDETIDETIAFVKKTLPFLDLENSPPSSLLSINYAQALPGTPLFEFARQEGFIENEEAYLEAISDIDAYSTDHFVNYTGLPLLKVHMWRHRITSEVDAEHIMSSIGRSFSVISVFGYFANRLANKLGNHLGPVGIAVGALFRLLPDPVVMKSGDDSESGSGYFNVKPADYAPLYTNPWTRLVAYPLMAIGVAAQSSESVGQFLRLLAEHIEWTLSHTGVAGRESESQSLRKMITLSDAPDAMTPLRLGR